MSLTERMSAWVDANADRLRSIGQVRFARSEEGSTKPSVHLLISSAARLGEKIVWDSGEVELAQGPLGQVHDEHHEVDDPPELDALLERLAGGFEP